MPQPTIPIEDEPRKARRTRTLRNHRLSYKASVIFTDNPGSIMRNLLIVLFSVFFVAMLSMTVVASLDRNVFSVGSEMLNDRWFQATLLDAYLAFLIFYVWVAYKERTAARRIIWFVLIMTLGTMAMASYVLWQLFRMPADQPLEQILLRRD